MNRVHLAGGRGNTISLLPRRGEKKNLECLAGIKVESWVRPRKNIRKSAKNRVTRTWIGGCSKRREEGGGGEDIRFAKWPRLNLSFYISVPRCPQVRRRRRRKTNRGSPFKKRRRITPPPPHFFMSTSSPTPFGRSPTERKVNSQWAYYHLLLPLPLFTCGIFCRASAEEEGRAAAHWAQLWRQNAIFSFLDKERKYT